MTIADQPWFVAADIRRALGVAQAGSNFSFLSTDETRVIPRGLTTGKGMATAVLLSESGLYKFILRSDKPSAKAFQNWVTRDVLPAIRKDGGTSWARARRRSPPGPMARPSRNARIC